MNKSLIERLRRRVPVQGSHPFECEMVPVNPDGAEAADEIERLQAALEPFARYYEMNDCAALDDDPAAGNNLEVPIHDLKRAHGALAAAAEGGDVKQALGEAPQSGPKGNAQKGAA